MFNTISSALSFAENIADKIWPDPIEKQKNLIKVQELAQKGDLAILNAELQIMLAQIDVNKEQAKSKSFFVAGARPAMIWLCGACLGLSYLLPLFLEWKAFFECEPTILNNILVSACVTPERLDMGQLLPILLGLLGVGGMRSFDKAKGTQTDRIKG